jgi:hypothetical protein
VEKIHIEKTDPEAGVHLACQLHPDCDMTIQLLNPATPSNWHSLPDHGNHPAFPLRQHDRNTGHHDVAVDLGTPHISIALNSLISGEELATRYGPNPQNRYSSDIRSRLQAASKEQTNVLKLQQLRVGGTFGRYLNLQNTIALGLLATIPAVRAELLNLSMPLEFERLIMENLYLRPQHE